MTFSSKDRLFSSVAVLALAVVLAVLAVVQYRWIGQVSEAATERMQASLQRSLMDIRQDLWRELARISLELQPQADQILDAKELAAHLQRWQQTDPHPALVSNVYVWQVSPAAQPLRRLNPSRRELVPVDWPVALGPLHERLQMISGQIMARPSAPQQPGSPGQGSPGGRAAAPPGPATTWHIDQNVPALVYPVIRRSGPRSILQVDWIVVELNGAVLRQHIFPELVERYLSGPDGLLYQVAVLDGREGKSGVLYSSVPGFGQQRVALDDAELNLWGMPFGKSGQLMPMPGSPRNDSRSSELHDRDFVGPVRLEPMHHVPEDGDWRIVVQNRKGSVEAAVAGLRRRNLAVSFGVLVVLAMTMALVVITAHRARQLARLQMDFVAGVSHELRTPLAVISSAAENIADGVVENEQQFVRYGTVILNQAKQLTHLVEQVLLFASTQQTRLNFNVRPVAVGEVIEAAIESTVSLASTTRFTLERRIEPGLPPVMADFSALSQCLQNLITNAVKYGGGESRWIGISARAQKASDGRNEVSVTVQDKGIGIDRAEMQHIFEPFYRSPSIAGSRIHGSGLGLALVRRTTEAMSGRLTAESEVGQGSSFTIHLSAAPCDAVVGDPKQIKALTNSADAVR